MARSSGSTLNPDLIRRKALSIADREGLEAVTVRRVTQECAVSAMALYAHFDDKQALLSAVSELVLERVALPDLTDAPWGGQLALALRSLTEALQQHPAVSPGIYPAMLNSRAGLVISDRVLGLLSRGGFDPNEAGEIARQLLASVIAIVGNGVPVSKVVISHPDDDFATDYPFVAAAYHPGPDCAPLVPDFAGAIDRLVFGVAGGRSV